MKTKLEIWKSDHNREERHYFVEGGDVGYQHNTYLFGYNPQLVPEALAAQIMALIEHERRSPGVAERPCDDGTSRCRLTTA
jgi:hypothetical protein